MARTAAQELAAFVTGTGFADLPPSVTDAAKVYLLDNFAAGFAGAPQPWTLMAGEMAREQGNDGPCSVFGASWRSSPSYAALVNGIAVGGFECDHAHVPASAHPAGAVFPAVLALGEQLGLDGASFAAAIVLGYEVLCRVGLAATRAVEDGRGFHGPGTNAAFGAAAGAGKALGLDAAGLTHALGIAGSHGGGLLEFAPEGAMTKRLHVGRGGQLGLESALLASRGFTGPSTVLEGEHGFLNVYSPAPRPELLTKGLGDDYAMLGVTVKAYPCHVSSHAVIEGVSRLRREQPFDARDIEAVRVTGNAWMMEPRFLQPSPETLMGAQYSLPFTLSVALTRGLDDPRAMSDEALADPLVRALAERIELGEDASRFSRTSGPSAELSITVNGETRTIVVSDWKGAPGNPSTLDDAAEKLRRYAGGVPRERVEEIIERVAGIEREPDAGALARLIAG